MLPYEKSVQDRESIYQNIYSNRLYPYRICSIYHIYGLKRKYESIKQMNSSGVFLIPMESSQWLKQYPQNDAEKVEL